jgi:transposase
MVPQLPQGTPPCSDRDWSAAPRAIRRVVRFLLGALAVLRAQVATLVLELTTLRAQVATAQQALATAHEELATAREKLATNSSNSSLPPSSDRPHQPIHVRRPKSKRRRGAQPGHPGHSRPLVEVSKVDRIIDVKPERCRFCDEPLAGTDAAPRRVQYFDLPPVKPIVEEYRQHELRCDKCGKTTRGELPADVQRSPFSPRVEATVCGLSGEYKLSRRATQALLSALVGLTLSLGAVSACEKRVSQALAAPVAAAKAHAEAQATVGYADETSYREGKRTTWMWVLATALVVIYVVQTRRTKAAAKRLLGHFHGVLVCDRLGSYNFYQGPKQTCWSHLGRLWKKWQLRGGKSEQLGQQLERLTQRMFKWWHEVKEGSLTRAKFARKMKRLRREIEECLTEATVCGNENTQRSATLLLKRREQLWTFVDYEGVEPTNNTAELAERTPVLWRKICFGTQSARGSRYAERILTCTMTLKMQDRNVIDYLTEAIKAYRAGKMSPSLIPPQSASQQINSSAQAA